MQFTRRSLAAAGLALTATVGPLAATPARADDRDKLYRRALLSLHELEGQDDRARLLSPHAHGVLVFPSILKAGLVFGGETGNGVLIEHGAPVGYYNLTGGSWGLQIGGQDFAYALFFMSHSALEYLHATHGWSVGTGPSITVINRGTAGAADVRSLTEDVYAFPYNGKGLMADLTLQGTKISRINPS